MARSWTDLSYYFQKNSKGFKGNVKLCWWLSRHFTFKIFVVLIKIKTVWSGNVSSRKTAWQTCLLCRDFSHSLHMCIKPSVEESSFANQKHIFFSKQQSNYLIVDFWSSVFGEYHRNFDIHKCFYLLRK